MQMQLRNSGRAFVFALVFSLALPAVNPQIARANDWSTAPPKAAAAAGTSGIAGRAAGLATKFLGPAFFLAGPSIDPKSASREIAKLRDAHNSEVKGLLGTNRALHRKLESYYNNPCRAILWTQGAIYNITMGILDPGIRAGISAIKNAVAFFGENPQFAAAGDAIAERYKKFIASTSKPEEAAPSASVQQEVKTYYQSIAEAYRKNVWAECQLVNDILDKNSPQEKLLLIEQMKALAEFEAANTAWATAMQLVVESYGKKSETEQTTIRNSMEGVNANYRNAMAKTAKQIEDNLKLLKKFANEFSAASHKSDATHMQSPIYKQEGKLPPTILRAQARRHAIISWLRTHITTTNNFLFKLNTMRNYRSGSSQKEAP